MDTLLWGDYHTRSRWPTLVQPHLPRLHALACQPRAVTVELGMGGHGATTAALLSGADIGGGELWTVDPHPPEILARWHTVGRRDPRGGYPVKIWHQHDGHPLDGAVRDWLPREMDVLVIGHRHGHLELLTILGIYMPRLRRGGVAVVHGTEMIEPPPAEVDWVPQPLYSTRLAVSDYCRAHRVNWENIPGGGGLGIITIPA